MPLCPSRESVCLLCWFSIFFLSHIVMYLLLLVSNGALCGNVEPQGPEFSERSGSGVADRRAKQAISKSATNRHN